MSLPIQGSSFPNPAANFKNINRTQVPVGERASSPFGEDSVQLSSAAKTQVAELHLNTTLAIQAAQAAPGTWQKYQHSYNGNSGSVRFVGGNLEWGK